MQLYQTPGGTWCGTQADWAKAMKAEGHDPKTWTDRRAVEVPTTPKAALLEFLTFHRVNVLNPVQPGEVPTSTTVPTVVAAQVDGAPVPTLDELFDAASTAKQAELAVRAIDRMEQSLR